MVDDLGTLAGVAQGPPTAPDVTQGPPTAPGVPEDAPAAPVPGGERTTGPLPAPLGVFRIMAVESVQVELPDQYPLLALVETEGAGRRLAFRIGLAEGAALAHALHGTMAPRPLTHDLFADVLGRLAVDVVAVRLVGRFGATYLAELELMGPRGREVVACRPSDGIVLALRQRTPAPVLADERLLSTVGDVPGTGTATAPVSAP